ncbi:6,7-dimethyl-8-ribityllumazine synthase [Gossypium australe]|uniref:6,7-dimethyl-8-ribityllumazine synthase n=1 Tax=Gossypium australe TaxID=47621 RepID=A0A5B6UI98_9ROSI|nr:6,7-dimethyl-8-ribityllumazine synthase [Gossypium australe]
MGNSIRCCLACVLPCGALDLIRIVHLNGHIEEITRTVTAGEILQANPNHVLTKPTSRGHILIISPHSQLQRGGIYFLIPECSLPAENRNNSVRRKRSFKMSKKRNNNNDDALDSGHRCLAIDDVLEMKRCRRRDRRKGGGGVWQPHLTSISED